MNLIVKENQTVFDVAIVNTGGIENAYKFCLYFNLNMTNLKLPVGLLIDIIPDNEITLNKNIVDFFKQQKYKPAMAINIK